MHTTPERAPGGAITRSQMNAVVLDRFGGVEELSQRSIPVPEVGEDDVLIRVEVAGVGSWDAEERNGEYEGAFGIASTFPYVLGWDAAGTVAAVGRNVTRFEIGDRVYAATTPVPRGGFYAEYGVVEAEYVAHLPDRLPIEQAGAMAWDALTAQSGLDLLDLRPGQTLMVFGASGGIGHMAVQLARHRGVRVLAVASGDDGVALAERLGADAVVDGRRDDVPAATSEFAPNGLDAALVTVGGDVTERALGAVKASGGIAWPNGVYPALATSPAAAVSYYDGDRSRAATDRLNAVIEAGAFRPHIAQTFPLGQAQDAHLALRDHYVGKLTLRIASDEGSS
ncbi:NADP-dependent oxidoreductase [Rhodococcus triatomae]|uniref:NADPH:quinone reductase n=1 Tax=Rhodococcus triatomae TaxID=300028 RepID=A0A1G8K3I9_9NOCA|nr:NADP-dependent oxidoreductase [Rhodococcus triatomae]QNG18814.1 NADP-dependent oxidoreductase [Rhodococcus triatomae]QNG25275.1 NADP-dependent oxidoreductase [Rhodococcus triatomae]SDI37937.1 NADPH:quinone reductase [Rhodococcus triatomae]